MSTALDNAGHNCNLVTEAESLIMAKEHLIDQYGTLRYTIGTGCSGGSLVQQQVANAYPGIYQGILPQCSFQDAWSNGAGDLRLPPDAQVLREPDEVGHRGSRGRYDQIAAVEGHPNYGNAIIFDTVYWEALANPTTGCAGVPSAEAYNPRNEPERRALHARRLHDQRLRPASRKRCGARSRRSSGTASPGCRSTTSASSTACSALEGRHHHARRSSSTSTRRSAARTSTSNRQPQRIRRRTNRRCKRSYLSGAVNEANNLKDVAIIDLRGPDPGAFHDAYRTWSMRARLEHAEGHFPQNDVIWFGEAPLIGVADLHDRRAAGDGQVAVGGRSRHAQADARRKGRRTTGRPKRPRPLLERRRRRSRSSVPGVGPVCQLPLAQTRFSTPRVVAGEEHHDRQAEVPAASRWRSRTTTRSRSPTEQWAQLQKAFPTGVCDFSQARRRASSATIPWQTYQNDAPAGAVIYGGKPLGRAPAGSGEGWTSAAFAGWLK